MNCPNCGNDLPEGSASCPNCGQPVIRPRDVVEPELVGDEVANGSDASRNGREGFDGSGFGGAGGRGPIFRNVVFTTGGAGSGVLTSCQTGIITMALAMAMLMQHGFLAFIGFVFFSALAKGIIFLAGVKSILSGRPANVFLMQVLSWFCCWTLVSWLATR